MWSVFFLFLSYLDGDFAKGELSALDAKKDSRASFFLVNTAPCVDPSACPVGLSPPKAADGKEKSERPETEDTTSDTQPLRRSKRGFTYPGTLWCGAGNIADNYEQLGEFAETDKCCRVHDHCPHVIHAFTSKYGFTNFKWHSISHCECDNEMKRCLRAVNDTSSRVVGQAFFNVIEVPCFEFSLEEQCVERHWYGVCKKYEKVPIAVIRESIPYDFGSIDVIDVLTIAPPKTKLSEVDERKQEESKRSESPPQSSTSKNPALEEPSLTNVVTAAEDFIKVLATVSTSQSSSADGGQAGETQTSEKKRKKNAGKKKNAQKKRKGKGKGKNRKQNTGRVPKVNDSVTVPLPTNRADANNKKMYVGDSGNLVWISKNANFMNSQFSSVGDVEDSNKMMRDEHRMTPDETQLVTPTATDANNGKILEEQKQMKDKEFVQLFSKVPLTVTNKSTTALPRQRVAKKRQRRPTPMSLPVKSTIHNMMADYTAVGTNKSTSLAGLTTNTPILLPEEKLHNVESRREKGSAFSATAQNTPFVGAKKLRSRQKGGRRKSRKLYSPSSPTDAFSTEEQNNLLTDTTQEQFGSFSEYQNVSQRLQPNGPKNMTDKPSTGLSRKNRLKTLKSPGVRNSAPHPKSAIKEEQEAISVNQSSSPLTEFASQAKDSEANTGQLFIVREQTLTPSMQTLKPKTSKRRSNKRNEKSKRKNQRQENLGLVI